MLRQLRFLSIDDDCLHPAHTSPIDVLAGCNVTLPFLEALCLLNMGPFDASSVDLGKTFRTATRLRRLEIKTRWDMPLNNTDAFMDGVLQAPNLQTLVIHWIVGNSLFFGSVHPRATHATTARIGPTFRS